VPNGNSQTGGTGGNGNNSPTGGKLKLIAVNSLDPLGEGFAGTACTISILSAHPAECLEFVLKRLGHTVGIIGDGARLLATALAAKVCIYGTELSNAATEIPDPRVIEAGEVVQALSCLSLGADTVKQLINPGS